MEVVIDQPILIILLNLEDNRLDVHDLENVMILRIDEKKIASKSIAAAKLFLSDI